MRRMDRHARLEQRVSELVQQRGPVARIDLDDGETVRRLVVDQHVGHDVERFGAWPRQRFGHQPVDHLAAIGERVLDRLLEAFELRGFVERAAERILDEEIVERHAVARGVDPRVDDVAPRHADRAGDAVEQAGMVGGVDRDERRAAFGIDLRRDRELGVARVGHQSRIAGDDVVGLGDPIGFGQAADERFELLRAPAEQVAQRGLLDRDAFAAALLLVPEAQHFLGRIVERRQQLPLPAVPHAGADRADIDDRQHQQQPQPLGALHHLGEIEDRLEVRQVALERRRRHQQMEAHQPGDGLGLGRRQAEARAQPPRDFGAEDRMVATAALGDVVEQHRDIERAARHDLVQQDGRERMVGLEHAMFDLREQADRADRVLVDGVMMVHVELHLRDDAAEIGNEAAEHAGLVHPAQHDLGVAWRGQHVEEEGVGGRVLADVVGELRIARRGTHRQRMDFEPMLVGEREQLEQPSRFLREKVVARDRQAPAVDDEAVELARGAAQRRQPETPPARGELLVQMREEHAGQIARGARLQEIELHEALDLRFARAVGEAHPLGDLALQVEGEAILGAPRDRVQVAAHRPEEILGAMELAIFGAAEQPRLDQLRRFADVVGELADPEERVEIAQAAFGFLDIGLDDVARVAHLLVAHVPLGELVGDELARAVGLDLALEAVGRGVIDLLVAPDVARLEQGGADRHVALRLADHLVERAAAVPDLHAEVPQRIEDRLDHLLGPAGLLPGGEEADIDIRIGRHLPAAVTADRDDRDPLGGGRVAVRVEPLGREIVEQAQQLVGQERLARGDLEPARGMLDQPPRDLRAPGVERGLEQRGALRAQRGLVAIERGERIGEAAPVDDRAALGNGFEAGGHPSQIGGKRASVHAT